MPSVRSCSGRGIRSSDSHRTQEEVSLLRASRLNSLAGDSQGLKHRVCVYFFYLFIVALNFKKRKKMSAGENLSARFEKIDSMLKDPKSEINTDCLLVS